MRTKIEMTGMVFGRLKVVGFSHSSGKETFWKCRCECGMEKVFRRQNLRKGHSTSCGCFAKETAVRVHFKHGEALKTPEYRVWSHMKERCLNPNAAFYCEYGGRGIKACDRWLHSYSNFLEDMGRRPTQKHTIERKNTDGDYCPENCLWITSFDQQSNRRNNKRIEFGGENLTLAQWERKMGFSRGKLTCRIKAGWDPIVAITTPNMVHMARL